MSTRPDLAALRREYGEHGLVEADLPADPWTLWQLWFDEVVAAGVHEPNAMVVATVDADGSPSARMVLLKGVATDGPDAGFAFFTNTASRKGAALAAEPRCALLFPWHPLERQVRVEGTASPLSEAEVAAYFASRPRGAQLGAWASPQSQVVAGRAELDDRYAEAEERFGDVDVPVPPMWGGYRVRPASFEFWQGRAGRMHDRIRYARTTAGWEPTRLAP
ncbi:pyridoxamine 5'-phosphate oxidase [Nocardioides nitrophenolicus]|uniref:pyridoxamine 5'-phosphate oxidase n=1 Tax=Nocardioides nitrophenolicus TaxID=60489 RepID=UPI00195D75FF|nr:pyridoxamine 5'-phosphate oxidase [Nocardioides nitrophenolicus]MBM7518425.1 pyridoxamine 5'-phosphate oxidase [Nocardioides nitrophenolicus]